MQGQSNSTTQTIHIQPTETQGQAPRPATGLRIKTNIKAGTQIALQRHFSALTKFIHVVSRVCSRKRRRKVVFDAPINPCVRSACFRNVAVGLTACPPLHRHGLAMGTLGLLLCLVFRQATPALADSASAVLHVVSYGSNKVLSYTIDANGDLHLQGAADTGKGPLTITLSPDRRFAYVANVNSHKITLYDMDPHGQLTERPTSGRLFSPTILDPARSLAIHPSGHRLYLPEYLTAGCLPVCAPSNSLLAIFALDTDGYLGAETTQESGQIPRAVAVTPDGRHVYVATHGAERVCIYTTDATTGDVTDIPGCVATGGSYPESVRVHPSGAYAYEVNGSGNVTAFRITSAGLLSMIQAAPAGTYPLDIAFHPSGTFAAVVDHDGSALLLYQIGSSGELLFQGSTPTGLRPYAVTFDKTGQFIYTADSGANSVSRFAFNATTGQPTRLGTLSAVPAPVALALFVP